MNSIFDQKTIVGLVCLAAVIALVFAGKVAGSDALTFIQWIGGSYFVATGGVQIAQKLAIGKAGAMSQVGTPTHTAMMRALGANIPEESKQESKLNTSTKEEAK